LIIPGLLWPSLIAILNKVFGEVIEEIPGYLLRKLKKKLLAPFSWIADKMGFSLEARIAKMIVKELKKEGIDVSQYKNAFKNAMKYIQDQGIVPTYENFIRACVRCGIPSDLIEKISKRALECLTRIWVDAMA